MRGHSVKYSQALRVLGSAEAVARAVPFSGPWSSRGGSIDWHCARVEVAYLHAGEAVCTVRPGFHMGMEKRCFSLAAKAVAESQGGKPRDYEIIMARYDLFMAFTSSLAGHLRPGSFWAQAFCS